MILLCALMLLLSLDNFVNTADISTTSSEDPSEGMGYIGYALEAFSPCTDGTIYMGRLIGLPPEDENYWNGTVDLSSYKGIPEARVHLTFDHPAVLQVDPNEARVNTLQGNAFAIHIFHPMKSLNFIVKGGYMKPFPNVIKVTLNGKEICKNKKKWSPTLFGNEGEAAALPLIPVDQNIPFCGRKKVVHTELVTKGTPTKPGDWPWHVALFLYNSNLDKKKYRCGGTIVSTTTTVTASHCVHSRGIPYKPERMSVIAGKYYMNLTEETNIERRANEIIMHPEFDAREVKTDIALIKYEDIFYDNFIQPICLWTSNGEKSPIYGKYGIVVGWGLDETDKPANALSLGSIRIVSDTTCILSKPTFYQKFVRKDTFCAGNGPNNGTSACNGDSGGGLVLPVKQVDGNPTWYLRGIVSVSVARSDKDVCDPDFYVVFTDVAQHVDWIVKNGEVIL